MTTLNLGEYVHKDDYIFSQDLVEKVKSLTSGLEYFRIADLDLDFPSLSSEELTNYFSDCVVLDDFIV